MRSLQLSQMNRRMAVRKRKNVVANGHAFQPLRFYQLIKCTVCGEFMLTVVGYQCQSKREHDTPCAVLAAAGVAHSWCYLLALAWP